MPSAYDSDGTSTIDAGATEDRFLPTSYTTSSLQENKAQQRFKQTTTSDAMSGISEMTYPPLDQLDTDDTLYAFYLSGRPIDSRMPPSAYSREREPSNRISGDSETLHSSQDHAPIIRTGSISHGVRAQGVSVVGIAPATLRNFSAAKRFSSSLDTKRPQSTDKSLHPRLSTTYEAGDDLSDSHKSLNSSYSPSFPSTTGTRGALLRSGPAEPHIKDTVMDSAPTSLLSRISGISLRRAFVWRKVKALPPIPKFPLIPLPTEYANRRYEGSSSASFDVSFGHPHTVYETGGAKSKNAPMAAASRLSPLHMVLSPAKHQPAATNALVRRKRRICFVIILVLIAVLAAIGAGVGVAVGSRKKQRLPACTGAFTGAACNLG